MIALKKSGQRTFVIHHNHAIWTTRVAWVNGVGYKYGYSVAVMHKKPRRVVHQITA
jgi:hypothetical protein